MIIRVLPTETPAEADARVYQARIHAGLSLANARDVEALDKVLHDSTDTTMTNVRLAANLRAEAERLTDDAALKLIWVAGVMAQEALNGPESSYGSARARALEDLDLANKLVREEAVVAPEAFRTTVEVPDEQLSEALEHRRKSRDEGLCDYCDQPYTEPPCRQPERHALAGARFYRGWHSDVAGDRIDIEKDGRHIIIHRRLGQGQARLFGVDGRPEAEQDFLIAPDRAMFEAAVNWVERHWTDHEESKTP